ncbi:magnesium-transporting ATPase (P-type) [Pedobacter sp. UYP24]
MKKIIVSGFIAGTILFIVCYGGLFLAVKFFPASFFEYNNPLFNSDGSRDVLFYMHAFIISFALSWFWDRFKSLFHGHFLLRGLEFGLVYAIVALLPVMWIIFSSLDITFLIVVSWFCYGLMQAIIAGIIFAKLNPM